MKKYSKWSKFIPILLVLVTMGYIILNNFSESGEKLISLEKAYKIAEMTALQWKSDALLYQAGSVDLNYTENYQKDKRAGWNFDFTSINSNEHYIIGIRYGQVFSKNIVKGKRVTQKDLIYKNEINLKFNDAVQKSIKDYSLILVKLGQWVIIVRFLKKVIFHKLL